MADPTQAGDELELQTQLLQYRASLYDPDTELPSLPAVLDEVRRLLGEQGSVQVLVVQIEQEQNLESIVGWERYDTLLRHVADYLRDALAGSRGTEAILCQLRVRSDRFLIFLADRRQTSRLLEMLAAPIQVAAEDDSDDTLSVGIRVGHGDIRLRPALRIERCIYSGITDAEADFNRRGEELDLARLRELHSILHERRVTTFFQPIIRLPQRTVVGYEALSRGPEDSYLRPAERLLGFAERSGLLGELEMLCVEKALASSHRLPLGSTVFLNLSYHGLEYLEGEQKGLAHLVRQAGWSPRECVLEITEHTYAEDPDRIKQRILKLRQQGFRVAIDDMGTGFSSLNTLAELRPDYIKLDHMLVRGVAKEPIKRNLISAITGFARTSQALVIAEGVEHQEEISALMELGVFLLQGYYFGRPAPV